MGWSVVFSRNVKKTNFQSPEKNINMNMNATLFCSRHIVVAKWNLF